MFPFFSHFITYITYIISQIITYITKRTGNPRFNAFPISSYPL